MAKERKTRRVSRRSRKATRKQRRIYGGVWYDPRTWGAKSTSVVLNSSVDDKPMAAPKSTMSKLFSNTQRNRSRSISPVLPSQEGSRYLVPKLRFSEQTSVIPIPKLGTSPVGTSSKSSTGRLRPNMAPNAFKQTSRGAENALVARHVAEIFQRSNSNQDMLNYLNKIQVAPHVKNRIRNQFLRNYGNVFTNNNNSTITNNSYNRYNNNRYNNNRNNSTRRRNNAAAAAYGVSSSFFW